MFPLQKQSSMYILQPAKILFTNHTIKAVFHMSVFLQLVQTRCCSLTLELQLNISKMLNQKKKKNPQQSQLRVERQSTSSASINTAVPVYWESTRGRVLLNQVLTDRSWKWICCHLDVSWICESAFSQLVSKLRNKLVLLDSVLVKPAEGLSEVPAQRDGEDIDEN